ncbi:prepilin-type N-terminal cleavage/methylation domain-containing protein, partial [Ruminococcus bicirculans (ex Wegman et al. 2014)]
MNKKGFTLVELVVVIA